jgi:hypothetical protein
MTLQLPSSQLERPLQLHLHNWPRADERAEAEQLEVKNVAIEKT